MDGDEEEDVRSRQLRRQGREEEMEDRKTLLNFGIEVEEPVTIEDKKHKYRREIVIADVHRERYKTRDKRYSREGYADKDS
jgi:hypothetical protein